MPYPIAPKHMYNYKSSTIKNFGYDFKTNTEYRFNSLGYRSDIEFTTGKNPIILLGNTISFGLGLEIQNTFSYIISSYFKKIVYNFSWGCYAHTNYEQLELLKSIIKIDKPSLIIFQINNLNRFRNHTGNISVDNPKKLIISEYKKFYKEISELLKNINHIFLHWDNEEHPVKLPNCLIKNTFLIDGKINKNIVGGKKSHKLIGLKIINEIKKQKLL
jgi:hypothetical protein